MLGCAGALPIMKNKRKAVSYPEGTPASKKRKDGKPKGKEDKASLHHENASIFSVPARRVASLNAELALHFMFDSPSDSSSVSHTSSCVASKSESVPRAYLAMNGHVDQKLLQNPDADEKRKFSGSSVGSARISPSSTVGSDSDEKHQWKATSPPRLKEPVIHIVDCKKTTALVKKPRITSTYVDSNGYVKRLASLNARARVTALIEPEKRSIKAKPPPASQVVMVKKSPPLIPLQRSKPLVEAGKCPRAVIALQCHPKGETHMSHNTITPVEVEGSITPTSHTPNFETPCYVHLFGFVTSQTQTAERVEEDSELESVPYNSVGLLYNGSAVHPTTRVFLTSEGVLPSRIVPVVVPSKGDNLKMAIRIAREQPQQKRNKPKAIKGDNSWTPIGDPIKRIDCTKETTKVLRRYYIGIRRRKEEVFVRDCIVVRAGRRKQDKPYIAKISSIWQEEGGIMMTVFWYYRPEDTGATGGIFEENELLASQHYDDNSVACVEERCYVLGFNQYCRYRASMAKRTETDLEEKHSTVPEISDREKLGINSHMPPDHVDQSLVFLCYRGYNHVSGKVCKLNK